MNLEQRGELARTFYTYTYQIQLNHSDLNSIMYGFIAAQKPKSIFEFGCNAGRHLKRLEDLLGVETFGIDINIKSVRLAKKNNLNIKLGDEKYLPKVGEYDIVLTNSVLCHIHNIDEIVNELKRIGKMVVIVETNSKNQKYYFKHDYEAMGFTPVFSEYTGSNKCTYKLYFYESSNNDPSLEKT